MYARGWVILLKHEMSTLYSSFQMGQISEEDYTTRKLKVRHLLKQFKDRIPLGGRSKKAIVSPDKAPDLVKGPADVYMTEVRKQAAAILEGSGRFTAVDVECSYTDPRRVYEIGISSVRKGVFTSRHLQIRTNREPKFLYGKVEFVDLPAAIAILQDELAHSDALVGHELKSDAAYLKKYTRLAHKVEFDTAWISRHAMPVERRKRLKDFAAFYGVKTFGMHVAGNDARVTLEAFMECIKNVTLSL